jgi:Glycogen recognition site of AMP-activated protein kinase
MERAGSRSNNSGGTGTLLLQNGHSSAVVQERAFSSPGSVDSTQPTPRRIAVSEEVQATLRLYSPGARKVFIAGTFNDWQADATPLKNVGNGEWVLNLMLKPGKYEYRFIADGQWQDDPQASERVKNPHGGWNALLRVEPRTIRLPALLLR